MPHKRPFCRYCGSPIRKRVRNVWFREIGVSFSDSHWRYVELPRDQWPRTKAECQRYTNQEIVSVRRWVDGTIHVFGEWDGESYSDPHFCKGECAKSFGYLAAQMVEEGRLDLHTKKHVAALKGQKEKQ